MVKGIIMALALGTLSTVGSGVDGARLPLIAHIAEIEVDPATIASYSALLAEEQEASVRLEPGGLMLHAVALANDPAHIRLFEVYANREAYEAHLQSRHFLKYKSATAKMVKSLRLVETTAMRLCAKSTAGGPASCM